MNRSKEDYIKAIYELGGRYKIVGNKDISENLSISPPSVSEMIKKLLSEDYIIYEQYKGVRLTEKGLKVGKDIRKRHLLWEVFLVEKLGYDWEEIHSIAENLEHYTDEKLEEKLEEFLGYPEYCPLGNPINLIDDRDFNNLVNYEGGKYKIRRIRDEKDVILFLKKEKIKIGDSLEILDRNNGYFLIKHKRKQIKVDGKIAEKIYVEEEKL